MTAVHVDLQQLDLMGGGTDPAGDAAQVWTPTRAVQGDTATILPGRATIGLADGAGPVLVVPTDPGWCYRVETYIEGGSDVPELTEFVLVPDTETVVEYSQLERVNPKTLNPASITPAWVAVVQQMIDEAAEESGVVTVNGQAGIVVLAAADVGAATTAQGAKADTAVQPGDLAEVATTGDYSDLTGRPTLGTAAAQDSTAFATASQGALAASAVQPDDLADVATSGAYADLTGRPSLGTAAAADASAFATAAQGVKADTAVQPGALAAIATSGDAADLTGTLPSSVIPPLLVNEVFTVASQAAMLALTAQRGDMAIRTDTGKTYVLSADTPTVLAAWKEIPAAGSVLSVNGQTGVVVLTKSDVGLGNVDNTTDLGKPISTATQTALNAKADTSSLAAVATTGAYSDLTGKPTALPPNGAAGGVLSGTYPNPGFAVDMATQAELDAHTTNTSNPHTVTKAQVGLGSVDNTADSAKPVSTAQQTALNLKADASALTAHTGDTANPHAVTKTQVGLGNVDNTSNATERAATATLTNKRISKRLATLATGATLSVNSDNFDAVYVTALAEAMLVNNPSGTPTNMQGLIYRIRDNGTGRALTYGSQFRAIGVTLPTTTVASKTLYLGCMWNSADSKWDVVAVAQEA